MFSRRIYVWKVCLKNYSSIWSWRKKKKKKKKKRSLLACVALVFNKINHWTTGTLCDIMEKKNIVWKLVFMHLSIVGKLTSRMNCI